MAKGLILIFWGFIGHIVYGLFKTLSNENGDFGKGKSKAAGGISEAGATSYERGKATPEEEAQYKRSFGSGQDIENIVRSLLGIGTAPSGYRTPEQQYLGSAGELGKGVYERTVSGLGKSPMDLYLSETGDVGQPVYERIKAGVGRSPTEQYLYETGDVGKTLYDQILSEAQDPYKYYESTLTPQLQLAEDYINRQAQGRGLLRSGIPIEQMGRAGVELAIKEAEARQNARANALARAGVLAGNVGQAGRGALEQGYAFGERLGAGRQDALARAAALEQYQQGLASERLANLSNLYGQQQQFGLQGMGRQANQAQMAAQYQAYPYQASLGSIYGTRSGLMNLAGAGIGALGMWAGAPKTTNIYGGGTAT